MKVKKDELYYFLSDKIGISAYVGIHGIAARGDIINDFMDLSKEDKAKNIMNIGLINARGHNLTLTCKFYGILPLLTESLKQRKQIHALNNQLYINGCDDGSQGQVMVVVAIPIKFIKSDNTEYFGGWIGNQSSDTRYAPPYCMSDLLFSSHVPPECILGYYTYKDKNDNEVDFHFNKKYISLLNNQEKDEFIEKYIENPKNPFVKMHEKIVTNNPQEQYIVYSNLTKNFQKPLNKNVDYYTTEELETISLLDIDLSRIKPSYDNVVIGRYNIKSLIINTKIFDVTLPHAVGLFTDKDFVATDIFENKVIECGNTPENLYKYWYTINKLDFDNLYKRHIRELQEMEIRKLSNSSHDINLEDT